MARRVPYALWRSCSLFCAIYEAVSLRAPRLQTLRDFLREASLGVRLLCRRTRACVGWLLACSRIRTIYTRRRPLRQDLFLTELDLHVCKHMVTTLDAWSEPGRSVQTHMRPSPCKLPASTGIGCVRRNKSLTRPGLTALCVIGLASSCEAAGQPLALLSLPTRSFSVLNLQCRARR